MPKERTRIFTPVIHSLTSLGILCLGAIAALIFPPFKNSTYGYIALIAFLYILFSQAKPAKRLFWQAYLFGFGFYVIGFSWINSTPFALFFIQAWSYNFNHFRYLSFYPLYFSRGLEVLSC